GGREQKSRGNRRPAADHGVGTENSEKSKNPRRRNPDGGAHKCQRQRDRAQRGNSTKQAESSVSEWKRAVAGSRGPASSPYAWRIWLRRRAVRLKRPHLPAPSEPSARAGNRRTAHERHLRGSTA